MDEQRHMPVRIKRIKGKQPGDHYFCEVCGVRWPCLAASEAAIQRLRERTPNVPPALSRKAASGVTMAVRPGTPRPSQHP